MYKFASVGLKTCPKSIPLFCLYITLSVLCFISVNNFFHYWMWDILLRSYAWVKYRAIIFLLLRTVHVVNTFEVINNMILIYLFSIHVLFVGEYLTRLLLICFAKLLNKLYLFLVVNLNFTELLCNFGIAYK